MNKLLVFAAIGVLVVAAVALSKLRGGGDAKEVEFATAEYRLIKSSILASGTLAFREQIELTPEVIGQYVDYFGDGNLGITGSLENISVLTTGLGIYFQKQATDGDNYLVDHSAAVLVIDPGGRFSGLFSGPHSVQNFVHDLPIIINGK